MPTRTIKLRLDVTDAGRREELYRISRTCARMATWLMQRYRAADGASPRLPDPLPTFESGPKKGRVDWAKAIGPPPDAKLSTPLYHDLREAFPEISAAMVSLLCHTANGEYRAKRFQIVTGRIRTPEYRDLYPIPVRDGCARLIPDDRAGGYTLEATIYSKMSGNPPRLTIPVPLSSVEHLPAAQRAALEQYAEAGKMPRIQIRFSGHRRRPRWMAHLPYQMEVVEPSLFDDRVLSVQRPSRGEFLRCMYRPSHGGRPYSEDLEYAAAWAAIDKSQAIRAAQQQHYRQQEEPSGRKGHGRRRAMECFTRNRERTLNRQRTFNYNAAKRIVALAERWRCATILFEDLGLVPKHLRADLALGDWSYYQLKTRLALLCEERGIKVEILEPPEMEITDDQGDHDETSHRAAGSA